MKKFVATIVLCVSPSAPAWAGTKMVTLSVSRMTCAACPITIKNALQKVEGVEKTEVNYDKKEAVVTYDDAKRPARKRSPKRPRGPVIPPK